MEVLFPYPKIYPGELRGGIYVSDLLIITTRAICVCSQVVVNGQMERLMIVHLRYMTDVKSIHF